MALDSSNVRVAVTGAVYKGVTGTTAPTSASSSLNAAFKDLGYVSEDGVTETRDRSTNQIKGWQNADLVREVVTDASYALTFTLIETKKETVETFYGATADGSDGSVDIVPSATGGRAVWVVDVIDGGELIRIHMASAEVTEVGDQVYQSGEAIGYQVTVKGYAVNGVTATKFYSALES
jgi:hypothetical protein